MFTYILLHTSHTYTFAYTQRHITKGVNPF